MMFITVHLVPTQPLCSYYYYFIFGHHVKLECAQGRKIIIPMAATNTVETLISILLTYKSYKWDR